MEYSFAEKQWLVEKPLSIADGRLSNEKNESLISHPQSQIFLGLHVPQRYDKVLDIDECHLQSHFSNQILNFTREFARRNHLNVYDSDRNTGYLRFLVIRESKKKKELMVNLVTFEERPDVMKHYAAELRECISATDGFMNYWGAITSRFPQVHSSRRMWHRRKSSMVW
jgi:23S rRNA (uracil1939-C5)-methyltransferase